MNDSIIWVAVAALPAPQQHEALGVNGDEGTSYKSQDHSKHHKVLFRNALGKEHAVVVDLLNTGIAFVAMENFFVRDDFTNVASYELTETSLARCYSPKPPFQYRRLQSTS